MHITSWGMNDMNERWVNETQLDKTLIIQQNLFNNLLIFFPRVFAAFILFAQPTKCFTFFSSFNTAHGQSHHTISFNRLHFALSIMQAKCVCSLFTLQNVNKKQNKDILTIAQLEFITRLSGSFSSQDCIIIVYSFALSRSLLTDLVSFDFRLVVRCRLGYDAFTIICTCECAFFLCFRATPL